LRGEVGMSSIRKHYTQMSKVEVNYLLGIARKITDWSIHGHMMERLNERDGLDIIGIIDTLHNGELIEYHNRSGFNRILVRGHKSYRGRVPCIVFDLSTHKVITFWWNRSNDNHYTIDMSNYNQLLDVIKTCAM
jgi:hypothetical protein